MRATKPLIIVALLLAVTLGASTLWSATAFDPSRSDPRAIQLADQVIANIGGAKAWNDLHYLSWTFAVYVHDTLRVTRRHYWDKWTGWHRVDGVSRTGTPFCFIDNLNTKEGHAWMGGTAIEGDSLKKLLTRSYAMWVNDLYWVAMPFKLKDPGVILQMDSTKTEGDQTWDKLALSFESVGLTPGDHYWLFVNRATHRIDRWEMVLQSDQPPPVGYEWSGWTQTGGCWFSTVRTNKDAKMSFTVAAPSAMPKDAFTSNAPMP